MTFPVNANKVRVRGYWYGPAGGGHTGSITFEPTSTNLTDMSAFGWIKTASVTVTPDPTTAYFYADLVATDDPDLTPFAYRVSLQGEQSFTINVPYNAPTVDVGLGVMKQAIWLIDAATITAPTPVDTYYTSDQTDAAIATAISGLTAGTVPDASTSIKGLVRLAGDLGGTAPNPTVPGLARKADHLDLVQEVVDRKYSDALLGMRINRRYVVDPAVGIPEKDLSSGVQAKLNPTSSTGSSSGSGAGLTSQVVGDRHVAIDAGIAERKLALASDANPATPSRRTLGRGARQAMPGDTSIPVPGTDVPPLVGGLVPAGYLPDGSVAGAPLDTTNAPQPLGTPTPGTSTRSSPADHVHARPATAQPVDHGLIAWSFDPANAGSNSTLTNGTLHLVRLWIPNPNTVVTGIILAAAVAGTSPTNCYVALFDASRNLLAQSANRAVAWGSGSGDKKNDLLTPQTIVNPGYVYAGWWCGGGTSPSFAKAAAALAGNVNNFNQTSTPRFSTSNTGLTTTAPSTAAAPTVLTSSYLVGLY